MFSTKHCFETKMMGYHSRLGDVMGQPYSIYACTCANHARHSLVHVAFCGSWKHSLLKYTWEKNLAGRKCQAYKTIYKICGKIGPFKATWTSSSRIVVVFSQS